MLARDGEVARPGPYLPRIQVAVKVLRPELAATLGSDRLLYEIEIAARWSIRPPPIRRVAPPLKSSTTSCRSWRGSRGGAIGRRPFTVLRAAFFW